MVNKNKYEDQLAWSFLAGILLLFAGFVIDGTSKTLTLMAVLGVLAGVVAVLRLRDHIDPESAKSIQQETSEIATGGKKPILRSVTAAVCALSLIVSIACPVSAAEILNDAATELSAEENVDADMGTVSAESIADLPAYIREQVAVFIDTYHITHDMTDADLANAYFKLNSKESLTAWNTLNELLALSADLSEEDANTLLAESNTILCQRFYSIIEQITSVELLLSNDHSFTPSVGGISVVVSAASDVDASDDGSSLTVSATGQGDCDKDKRTATITVTNTKSTTATVSFTWKATSVYKLTIDGSEKTGSSDTFEKSLNSGASFTIVINTDKNTTKNTLVLSNFNSVDAKADATVTFYYDGTLGSVTAAGSTVANEGTRNATNAKIDVSASVTNSGDKFLGWINNATGEILNTKAECTLDVVDDIAIRAVFGSINATAWFEAGGYLFTDLSKAASKSTNVKLAYDGRLSSATHTIPSGAKLLIPYSEEDSGTFQAKPGNYLSESQSCSLYDSSGIHARNFAFRTLIIPSGSKIICKGSINVNGQRQKDGQPYSGVTLGGYGKIHLEGAATEEQISIESGANLYCYGYITGTGMVNVKKDGSIYELMQVCDWPGGSNAEAWNGAATTNTELFPLSNFYIQNVESKLRINYGATAYVEAVFTGSGSTVAGSSPYIGTSTGIFHLTSENAYIERIYDTAKDRMDFHMYGNIELGSIQINERYFLLEVDLDSSDYILPLNAGMKIIIEDGCTFTMDKKAAILPGAEVVIQSGGVADLSSQLYIFDVNDWSRSYFFHRATMALCDGYTMANKYPKFAPVPYVATLDDISPRTTALVRGYTAESDGSNRAERYYMSAKSCSDSGKLVVNGKLNVSGILASTSTSKSNDNKIITGSGVINHTSTPAAGALKAGYSKTISAITTSAGVANFAGIGKTKVFPATGTYYNLGSSHSNYWYTDKTVTAGTCTVAGSTTYNCAGGTGYVVNGAIDPNNHTVVVDKAVDATCTSAGKTEGKHCSACSKVLVAQTTVPNLGHTEVIDKAVDATCTESGKTQGKHCSVCGEVIVAQETVDALGHKMVSNNDAVLPTYQETGLTASQTCSVCGETVDGTVVPKVVELNAYAASAAEEIYLEMKFFLPEEMANGTITLTHTVTKNGNTTTDNESYNVADLTPDANGRYVITHGIASGEMTCPVIVSFKTAGGKVINVRKGSTVSEFASCAVTDYAELVLTKGNENQKKLITNLLTYGGYAQALFNVDASKPAYNLLSTHGVTKPNLDEVTASSISNVAAGSGPAIGIQKGTQEAFLDSAIYHRVYFTLDAGNTIDNFKFVLTYPVNKVEYTKELTPVFESGKDRYYVEIEDIPAAYLDYDYKISVTNKNTSETYTVTTSVLAYLKALLNSETATTEQKNLAKAMYLYNQQANTFFGK